jgi:hypothetical protein
MSATIAIRMGAVAAKQCQVIRLGRESALLERRREQHRQDSGRDERDRS